MARQLDMTVLKPVEIIHPVLIKHLSPPRPKHNRGFNGCCHEQMGRDRKVKSCRNLLQHPAAIPSPCHLAPSRDALAGETQILLERSDNMRLPQRCV